MTRRQYEIEVAGDVFGLEVEVDVRHGEVTRVSIVGGDVPPSRAQDVLAEVERVVDLDHDEILEACEQDAHDRAMDEKISAWKETRR